MFRIVVDEAAFFGSAGPGTGKLPSAMSFLRSLTICTYCGGLRARALLGLSRDFRG